MNETRSPYSAPALRPCAPILGALKRSSSLPVSGQLACRFQHDLISRRFRITTQTFPRVLRCLPSMHGVCLLLWIDTTASEIRLCVRLNLDFAGRARRADLLGRRSRCTHEPQMSTSHLVYLAASARPGCMGGSNSAARQADASASETAAGAIDDEDLWKLALRCRAPRLARRKDGMPSTGNVVLSASELISAIVTLEPRCAGERTSARALAQRMANLGLVTRTRSPRGLLGRKHVSFVHDDEATLLQFAPNLAELATFPVADLPRVSVLAGWNISALADFLRRIDAQLEELAALYVLPRGRDRPAGDRSLIGADASESDNSEDDHASVGQHESIPIAEMLKRERKIALQAVIIHYQQLLYGPKLFRLLHEGLQAIHQEIGQVRRLAVHYPGKRLQEHAAELGLFAELVVDRMQRKFNGRLSEWCAWYAAASGRAWSNFARPAARRPAAHRHPAGRGRRC